LPSRYEEAIYNMLSDEPVTPNEAAKKLLPSIPFVRVWCGWIVSMGLGWS